MPKLAALFIPQDSSEITLEEAMHQAAACELVPCAPVNFSEERPFKITFFPPEHIPRGFRRFLIAVKTPTTAAVREASCAA